MGFRIVPNIIYSQEIHAVNGSIDFSKHSLNSTTFPLFGNWEYYPNVYISNSDELQKLHNPSYIEIPLTNFNQAINTASFKLRVENLTYRDEMILFIQNIDNPIDVYVNGIKQNYITNTSLKNLHIKSFESYSLPNYMNDTNTFEIVLSIKETEGSAPLFKRVPIITTTTSAYSLSFWSTLVEAFLFSMLVVIALNGFAFMILRPQHIAITSITLFDTILIFRMFFASENLHTIIESLFSFITISDKHIFSSQIFLLLLSGFVGLLLAKSLLDGKKKIPAKFTNPVLVLYLLLIFTLPFNFNLYYGLGKIVLKITYLYTNFLIIWHIISFWKTHKNGFALFNIIRTLYVTFIITIDILYLGEFTGFPIFYYPLLLFFFGQMFMKLIDNSKSYNEVYELNKSLEQKVEERTKELFEKNKKLSEISTHDPLTGAYNRLYFDEQFEIALTIFDEKIHTLHLCMFDLDHFKSINDTFGHAVGDEQLIYAAKTVQEIVLKNSVFARVGGEEFMILYTESNTDVILENIESIRFAFEKMSKENKQFTTSSFGVTKYVKTYSKKDFLKIADKNLYEAKSTGRNKVVFH